MAGRPQVTGTPLPAPGTRAPASPFSGLSAPPPPPPPRGSPGDDRALPGCAPARASPPAPRASSTADMRSQARAMRSSREKRRVSLGRERVQRENSVRRWDEAAGEPAEARAGGGAWGKINLRESGDQTRAARAFLELSHAGQRERVGVLLESHRAAPMRSPEGRAGFCCCSEGRRSPYLVVRVSRLSPGKPLRASRVCLTPGQKAQDV